jgi:hypothetical protein
MIDPPRLRRFNILILVVCWLSVSLPAVLIPHTPVGEEAAIVQAGRDLNTSSDLAPEPGLPQWLARLTDFLSDAGADVLALRSLAVCAGLVTVLMSGALAARWFGRRTGLLAGLVAATSAGLSGAVWHSGVAIWLSAAVLTTVYWFSEIEFPREATDHRRFSRSWLPRGKSLSTAGLVSWLGITAALIGPAEIGIVLVLPLGVYLLRQRREATLEILRSRGWLVTAGLIVVAVSLGHLPGWPSQVTVTGLADSASLWAAGLVDGASRLDRLAELGRTVMPWGFLVPFGLWLTRHEALAIRNSRERLLLCVTLTAPLVSVLLFPELPNLIPAACCLWSVSAAVALNRIWLVATTTSQGQWRATLIPASRIGFSAAALLCILSGLVGEWSRPELLDDDFLSRVASTRNGEHLQIDVDAQDRVRVLSGLKNHSAGEAASHSRALVVSSPGQIANSAGDRPYRKLLESQHRAGQDDCLTLYEIGPSQIAAQPSEIR